MTSADPLMLDLERIEREAWIDLVSVAPVTLAERLGLAMREINNTRLLVASHLPQLQFNWLSGAGLKGDDGRSIDEAIDRFRRVGQRKFFIQIPPGPNAESCIARARAHGLTEHPLAWAKFHRLATAAPLVNVRLQIREVDVDERDVFAATVSAGFGMPNFMAAWLSQIVGRAHWHAYVSFNGREPIGATQPAPSYSNILKAGFRVAYVRPNWTETI